MKDRRSRADWLHEAKWGAFMHFLAAPAGSSGGAEIDAEAWNRRVDGFDVAGAAEQLREIKAGYFVLTMGQSSGHYCAPNEAYDQITGIVPSKCSRRDLVSDLYEALAPHGIRLMVYMSAAAPEYDPVAVAKLGWVKGERNAGFQRKWEAVIREWSLRWGRKVSGWWFDGCYYNDVMYQLEETPNFKSFADATRAGNPDSLIAWNPGVKYPPYTVDEEEDYTGGEVNEPREVDAPGRWDKHAQFHILSYLGKTWGVPPIRFSGAEAAAHTLAVTDCGGAVTWDVPLTNRGLIIPEAFSVLKQVGAAVAATLGKPDRDPPRVVRPSIGFWEVPVAGDRSKAAGRLRLTLKNPWREQIRGTVSLSVEPSGYATLEGDGRVAYDLDPEAAAVSDISFTLDASASATTQASIVVTRAGDARRLSYRLPSRERLVLPSFSTLPALDELASLLKDVPERLLVTEGGYGRGSLKLAVTADHLAIAGRMDDLIVRQTPGIWDGSCIEVFGVDEPGDPINQLFFVPATPDASAKAYRLIRAEHHSKMRIVPAPEPRYATWAKTGGYVSAALIPLAWWLKRSSAPRRFYLEICVSAGETEKRFGRVALFGNQDAAGQSDGYACVTVEEEL
ncbi:MAG: hypothetical protein PHR35_20820 [Kiritimatiellae bacterium]|nr:hypothetical protein [Kiritimatiellia bacterium]